MFWDGSCSDADPLVTEAGLGGAVLGRRGWNVDQVRNNERQQRQDQRHGLGLSARFQVHVYKQYRHMKSSGSAVGFCAS